MTHFPQHLTLIVYVPATHAEAVKAAIFAAGAGEIGPYQHCCWQVVGQGQFMPLADSKPHIGKHHQLETVAEVRLECLCQIEHQPAITAALIAAHPYETPAFGFLPTYTTALSSTHDSN